MAVNFQNSAGTDLDNLFYIDNGNAGAIGFQASNGQDLGNRYTNQSTLGYGVGFQNVAGTDLGYLRGKLARPSGTFTANSTVTGKYGCVAYDSEGSCDRYGGRFSGNLNWAVNAQNYTSVSVKVEYAYDTSGGTSSYFSGWITKTTSTSISGSASISGSYSHCMDCDATYKFYWRVTVTLYNGSLSTTLPVQSGSKYMSESHWAGGA